MHMPSNDEGGGKKTMSPKPDIVLTWKACPSGEARYWPLQHLVIADRLWLSPPVNGGLSFASPKSTQ